ncbi:unnamed protein product [Kuraishia capsulata CBS 1993]|uniref:ABC transporter domain-containing protein n=1 Tax=Kuraishia capsulata CBS 1993 TaxID=1382522 RepID=W6MH37_9ASCO|nr:uncharacterized protein KUCA_T00001223001 [Kuraishia capsulata CBS 1993]CDK25256.1 unnamed protein product [Kuraishia capsulata CBS 1993]
MVSSDTDSIVVKSDAGSDVASYRGFDATADEQVHDLARKLTNESGHLSLFLADGKPRPSVVSDSAHLVRTLSTMSNVPGVSTFTEGEIDSRLDPNSDDFDSKLWVKNFRKLMDNDPDYYKHTSLGIAYRNLRASGIAADASYQPTILNYPYKVVEDLYNKFAKENPARFFDILKPMDAIMKPGSLTVVLGRPGAGCSTLLKTISAQTYGFKIAPESEISYDGFTMNEINKHYRGEVVYSAEVDNHFPHLTVGQTLNFAAGLRTPQNRGNGINREVYAKHMTDVYMATYGLLHTRNTKVGNDLVRGVSGGERKRVSIAEVSLCGSALQCWDNATRGLDAATALEFIRALKTSAVLLDTTPLIAIYQCSQDAYDLFDNVIVLYEGYQIYFGLGTKAKDYFLRMGYDCPPRQTTADFLTSLTNPSERVAKPGFENKVPKTPKEFSDYWRNSPEFVELTEEVDAYIQDHKVNNATTEFLESKVARQSNHTRPTSSYTVSYSMQIKAILRRNWWRLQGDPSITLFSVIANTIMGLLLSSLFYNLPATSGSFYYRSASLFFAVLFNAFSSLLEVMALFESRPIIEKHKKYALYHPSADAMASIISEFPPKLITAVGFNLVFYFMVNFRRNPGRFFFYFLVNFLATLAMSHIFRSIGSFYKTLSEAMSLAALILLALVIYTGFVVPTPSMLGWSRWINYLDPIAYVFESLMTNEFQDRLFECSAFIPSGEAYSKYPSANKVCSSVSSVAGEDFVNGTKYVNAAYAYYNKHKWRNVGVVIAFVVFFLGVYLAICELSRGSLQKGEVLVFQSSTLRKLKKQNKLINSDDPESALNGEKQASVIEETGSTSEDKGGAAVKLSAGKDIFHWRDVCYEVNIKTEVRKILNHVDGWVKPGTLTALMGASGAGKTTLLDVLANRVTMGVVTGSMFVNGRLRDDSFQRSTGYVQQQDLHLQTATVRESLRFSAYLRQPASVSQAEKDEYVENVIEILEMEKYADAIVGVSGEGLNVEQRKRLTIGVELAAKPQLLLFLDEPTSGLDSQTAWSICQLMRKLADNGQAILCTIHQPSAILLQEFDRLLFLARGGRTVYFGDLGENCTTLIDYFEKHGAHPCPHDANPAEWMLEVIGAAPGSHANQDYHEVWMNSAERAAVRTELATMEHELVKIPKDDSPDARKEFAAPLWFQYTQVTRRVFEQYFRTPTYIWSKLLLTIISAIFNGFSFFKAGLSLQGLQNQMLAIFMFLIVLMTLTQQYLPNYVFQRGLYEARERPSKTFSWLAFILAQITVEIPWQMLCGTLSFFCWYYPVGMYENAVATDTVHERGALIWLYIVAFFVYASTLAQLCVAGMEIADNAANLASLMFTMSLNFCGILKYPSGFWIFMYRVSPFTYWVQGVLSTGVGKSKVTCSTSEYVHFPPPSGMNCGDYMKDYISAAGGYLLDEDETSKCSFCSTASTDVYLASVNSYYSQRWRNYGIYIAFIFINIFGTVFLYWLVRVPKSKNRVKDEAPSAEEEEQKTIERQLSRTQSRNSKKSRKSII